MSYPPVLSTDPYPGQTITDDAITGLSEDKAQECKAGVCELYVAKGVSASGVKIYRQDGTISEDECARLQQDTQKVNKKEMSFKDWKNNLLAGKYYNPIWGNDGKGNQIPNGYCEQWMFDRKDLNGIKINAETDWATIPWSKLDKPKVRKVSADGGFSADTKLFLKPNIPFQYKFGSKTVSVPLMTLFHPCPIRVKNVQYDAVLTLGDPGMSPAGDPIMMIPLKGSISPGPSGSFLSKIASAMPGVLKPDPLMDTYKVIDAPVGKDWDLSKFMPGSPVETSPAVPGQQTTTVQTKVNVGYYAWTSTPSFEKYIKTAVAPTYNPVTNAQTSPGAVFYGWRESKTTQNRTYIMLENPVAVNVFDMQTIRMLPMTPSEKAVHLPNIKSLVYVPPTECGYSFGRENFEVGKVDACDPFASMPKKQVVNSDTLIKIIIGLISAFAVFIGIYLALKYVTTSKGDVFKDLGVKFGRMVAGVSKKVVDAAKKVPTVPVESTETPFQVENPMMSKEKKEAAAETLTKKQEEEAMKVFETSQPEKVETTALPKELEGAIEKAEPKEGETFAFKNPMAQRQKTLRNKQESKKTLRKLPSEDAAAKKREAEELRIKAEEEAAKQKEAEALEKLRIQAEKEKQEIEDTKKDLKEKMDRTDLSEDEQRKIRKEYQKLTGIYHPTKKEQEAASGTGFVKKRIIAEEPPDEEEPKKTLTRNKGSRSLAPPPVPAPLKPRTLGIDRLGLREDTAKPTEAESKRPPIPPKLEATVAKLEQKKEDMDEEQKARIERARERIAKAMSDTQERKMKEQLASLKEKQAEDKEKVSRDLAEARSRLRSAQTVYRRGQQGRNLYTGRGKTARN